MTRSIVIFSAITGLSILALAVPAQALTMQECSAKYEAAKTAGTLGDKKWNDFRKAECGTDAKASDTKPAAATAAAPKAAEAAKPVAAPKEAAKPAAPVVASGPVVFPTAVSPKYSSEKPGKARMQTCLDQYNANKTANTTGGMKWIQKGGGYYSQCNAKLKG